VCRQGRDDRYAWPSDNRVIEVAAVPPGTARAHATRDVLAENRPHSKPLAPSRSRPSRRARTERATTASALAAARASLRRCHGFSCFAAAGGRLLRPGDAQAGSVVPAATAALLLSAPELARPIPLLASGIPQSATLNTAIHTLHTLPNDVEGELPGQLLDIAQRNGADALGSCHRALELDGADRGFQAADWLPTVYDIAGPLLESAPLDTEPPTLVQVAQEAISWLSRAIAEFDEGSEEAPTSLAETLARLLAVWTFTDVAPRRRPSA
jgi:hypothetical protein